MAKPTLSTVFTAQDMMSPQIKKMKDSVSLMSEKIQHVNQKASGSFLNLKNAAIVTLGVMALGKIKNFAEEFATTGDEIAKTSSRLGMTSVELQRLRYAMGQQGVSSETLTQSFEVLNKNLGLLQNNQGALYSKLRKNNPEMLTQLKGAKNNSEAFTLLMDALDKTSDATEKAALSTIAFGGAGQMMILASKGGSKTLNELGNAAERFGVISNEDAAKAEGLNDSLDNMSKSIQGLINVGYAPLLQNLTPVVNRFADFIAKNKEFISLGINKVFQALEIAINLVSIGMDSGLIPAILIMVSAFKLAKMAIIAHEAAIAALAVIHGVMDVGLIATTKLIIAQNLAWMANPIGLVIISIAAIIAIFVILYKNIDSLNKMIDNFNGFLGNMYDKFMELGPLGKTVGAILLLAFSPLILVFGTVYLTIMLIIKGIKALKNLFSDEDAIRVTDPTETKLPGMEAIQNLPQSANSGMLSQTINRNNNSNVVVDFKNLPQFANVTQKGTAPNISINRGMNIDPFILFGGGIK